MGGSVSSDAPPKSALPRADLSAIDAALAGGDAGELAAAIRKVRPADLGHDLSRRPIAECARIIAAADDRPVASMLRAAHPTVAAGLLGALDPARAAKILLFMPIEVQAEIMGLVGRDAPERIDQALPADDRQMVDRLLAHAPASVGRLMTPKIWRAPRTDSAARAMGRLREKAHEIEVAANCYVVDEEERLVGVVPLRTLALLPANAPLAEVMTPDPIAVGEDSERGDAAEIIRAHEFLSLPVVDKEGRLVGAVRIDDLLDAALSKLGAGILNQGGVAGKIAAQVPYFQTSLFRVVRSRLTWLVLLFVAETATGTVLRHFESELAKVVALSFFIPLLIGTGGNAGSQTVSTIIRALALGEVRLGDALRVVFKEVTAGVVLGLLLGTIAFGRALLWGVHADLALCVGVTVLVVCTWANTVGSLIPLGAERLGIDPTVVSGPLITTLVDASGLFIYLTIAHIMIAELRGAT
ncbi:MAG TPA: magnesium transporter [Planctomycetota bacterium]|nr:magnesium transporter [Planctomycetota bacterium]